jgi:hypothetical protein
VELRIYGGITDYDFDAVTVGPMDVAAADKPPARRGRSQRSGRVLAAVHPQSRLQGGHAHFSGPSIALNDASRLFFCPVGGGFATGAT